MSTDRFKKPGLVIAASAALWVGVALADEVKVQEENFGLSGSVFDTPDPIVPSSAAGEAGENEKLGSYFEGMPPMISHQIADYLPITAAENLCLDCHDLRDEIGGEIGADEPTPMPESHYTDLRQPGSAAAENPVGARYTCVQCHAPQSDAEPLVASTYGRGDKR